MAKLWPFFYILACKEMTTTMKKVLIWMVPVHVELRRMLSTMVQFHWEFNGE